MATEAIFAHIQQNRGPHLNFKVRASYLQIYKEVVSDLLAKSQSTKQLAIRQSKGRVSVDGLSEWIVKSPNDIYGLMERGCSVRATSATRMSELSSRSHAIFQIVVEIFEGDEEVGRTYKVGKLNIVDLAGSEKVRATGVTGERLEEAKKINWSLHQLGNVISALADPNRRDPHIPYRNSKLTHMLTDSLGGNCKTTLIACISPAYESYAESVSTLKFANRAKNIKNDAIVNEESDQSALIAKYAAEIQRLRSMLGDREASSGIPRSLDGERDRMFDEEKREKQRLEGRIGELERQLLASGVGDGADDRSAQREDVAQVDRYKQLLLKQRDIMLNLTQRLNERDETILRLQEELDAYDSHVIELEERLEGSHAGSPTTARALSRADAERVVADSKVFLRGGEPRYQAAGDANKLLTAEEKMVELLATHGSPAVVSQKPLPTGGAPMDGATLRSMQEALMHRAERLAKELVADRCHQLLQELADTRGKLAKAEQAARTAEAAADVTRAPQLAEQSERMKAFLQNETNELHRRHAAEVDSLKKQLSAERDAHRAVSAEMARVSFDIRQLKDAQGAGRSRELDELWDQVRRIESATTPDIIQALASAAAPSSGRGGHVDPTATASPSSSANQIRVMQLESAVDTLQRQQQATKQEMQSQIEERDARVRSLEKELASRDQSAVSLRRALQTHEKDRAALKKILEQRIKTKLENISNGLRAGADIQRVNGEVSSLMGLVVAAIDAMNAEQTSNPQSR
uniref:Kinesin-like protein n=1 Tax=Neobodo designis TaxID=312471 RepID=A0A7S1QWY4_NEODS